jgi:shikimate kinase
MGSGKTRVGGELARLLKMPFIDADREIESAAGMAISEIFEKFGEREFRSGERKVMQRLLSGEATVIATGGGAFIQDGVRKNIQQTAISVWLKADLDILMERVAKSDHRPLLKGGDPAIKLQELIEARYPVYAEADITVVTDRQTPQDMAKIIRGALEEFLKMEMEAEK